MNLLLFFFAVIGMEVIAWLTHKFIMHGILWKWHKDHHVINPDNKLQKNDYFFLIFASPGMLCLFSGVFGNRPDLTAIGLGITFYGLIYFIVHDVYIHRRIKWFRKINLKYLNAVTRCHKLHHKNINQKDSEYFGLLWIPFKYYRK
jgi:beta-carotene 3-hydroxylase